MKITFLGQPLPTSTQLGEAVRSTLGRDDFDHAWFVTAWGKQSGLSRIVTQLAQFRDDGGVAEILLGVDEGGATIEGLRLAQTLFDDVHIFHDPGARTFHPKMYVFQGGEQATVLIGSGNLTRGGLFTNYEVAVLVELDLADSEDSAFLLKARAYYEELVVTPFAKPLTDELIQALQRDPRIRLLSERRANQARAGRRSGSLDGESVFGTSAFSGLLGAPHPDVEAIAEEDEDDDDALIGDDLEVDSDSQPSGSGPGAAEHDVPDGSSGASGFFKVMSNFDVSTNSAPGQIIIPISFLPFFGELTVRSDESAQGGPSLKDRDLPLTFRDGTFEKEIPTGRVILYEPASAHKRRNREVRFTFTDRDVNPGRLQPGDVLVFSREEGGVVVERRPNDWRPPGVAMRTRYGLV